MMAAFGQVNGGGRRSTRDRRSFTRPSSRCRPCSGRSSSCSWSRCCPSLGQNGQLSLRRSRGSSTTLLFVRPESERAWPERSEVRNVRGALAAHAVQPEPVPAQRMDGADGPRVERRVKRARAGFTLRCCSATPSLALLLGFEVASRFFYESWAHAFSHRSERSQRKADSRRRARLASTRFERFLNALPTMAHRRPSARARAQRHARLLARPRAMDAGDDLLRPADHLRAQPAQRCVRLPQRLLEHHDLLPQPRRLRAHPLHAHNPVRVPAIYPLGGTAAVDHRARAARAPARGHAEILDRLPRGDFRDGCADRQPPGSSSSCPRTQSPILPGRSP